MSSAGGSGTAGSNGSSNTGGGSNEGKAGATGKRGGGAGVAGTFRITGRCFLDAGLAFETAAFFVFFTTGAFTGRFAAAFPRARDKEFFLAGAGFATFLAGAAALRLTAAFFFGLATASGFRFSAAAFFAFFATALTGAGLPRFLAFFPEAFDLRFGAAFFLAGAFFAGRFDAVFFLAMGPMFR